MEISSHTDAQGGASYNQKLSQRRANAIVTWLIGKGIGRERLVGKGYGEERLVNGCYDGVSCSEEEHQMKGLRCLFSVHNSPYIRNLHRFLSQQKGTLYFIRYFIDIKLIYTKKCSLNLSLLDVVQVVTKQ